MPNTDTTRLYATHPHLRRIDELWGKAECRALLTELMSDSRGGARAGFAPENASTLLRLLMEHDRSFPQFDESFKIPVWQRSAE